MWRARVLCPPYIDRVVPGQAYCLEDSRQPLQDAQFCGLVPGLGAAFERQLNNLEGL